MADNNIYLVKKFSALEECERKYDFMPAAETSSSKGYDHYCCLLYTSDAADEL